MEIKRHSIKQAMGQRKKKSLMKLGKKTLSQMKMNIINQNLIDVEKTVPRGKSINTYIKNKNLS